MLNIFCDIHSMFVLFEDCVQLLPFGSNSSPLFPASLLVQPPSGALPEIAENIEIDSGPGTDSWKMTFQKIEAGYFRSSSSPRSVM